MEDIKYLTEENFKDFGLNVGEKNRVRKLISSLQECSNPPGIMTNTIHNHSSSRDELISVLSAILEELASLVHGIAMVTMYFWQYCF